MYSVFRQRSDICNERAYVRILQRLQRRVDVARMPRRWVWKGDVIVREFCVSIVALFKFNLI